LLQEDTAGRALDEGMAPFPPWGNSLFRYALLGAVLLALGTPLALMGWVRSEYARGQFNPLPQPVPFDHRHHVRDDGIDCRYCHRAVETSSTAGFPPAELCMNCHSQVWIESPLLATVRESYFRDLPIAWRRLYVLPDFVFFNHAIHVNKGVGCESCHGRVDQMPRIYQVPPLTMHWCLDCHRDPVPNLRPADAITRMGWHGDAALQRQLAEANHVQPGTSCSTCHR
jgi:hypothetical protein